MASYRRLAELAPDRADAARLELGNLISKLMADLHASVHAEQPPPGPERGLLCWHGFRLGQAYRQLQLQLPDWLWHLEEQLVREGSISLRQLSQSSDEGDETSFSDNQRQRWRRQALELLLHLGRLHQPCPDWILQAARELVAAESDALLSRNAEASATELQQLLGWLARLPLPADQLAAVQGAAQRGI